MVSVSNLYVDNAASSHSPQPVLPQPHSPQHPSSTPPPNPPTSTPSQPQAEAAQPSSSSQPSSSQLMSVPVTSQAMPGPNPQLSQDVATPHPLQVGEQQALQGQPPLQHIPSHQPLTVAQYLGIGSDSGPPQAKNARYELQSHGTGSSDISLQANRKRKSSTMQSHSTGSSHSFLTVAQSHGTGSDSFLSQAKKIHYKSPVVHSHGTVSSDGSSQTKRYKPPMTQSLGTGSDPTSPQSHGANLASQSPQSASAYQPQAQAKYLTIDDLADLQNVLRNVASKRLDFGLHLRVKYTTLCTIQSNHKNTQDQLHEILAHRLTQLPLLTWHDIVQALRSNTVQMNDLARVIESQYILEPESQQFLTETYIPASSTAAHQPQSPQSHGANLASQSPQSASAYQPQAQAKYLTIDDLADLQNVLHNVASKRFDFGLQLRVKYATLCTIQSNHKNTQDQLREILAHRLARLPPLTWYDIVQALRSNTVQMNDLARVIESQYILEPESQQFLTETYIPASSTAAHQPQSQAKELTIDDLADLVTTLYTVAPKCIAFGLQLGVDSYRLQAIETQYVDPHDRLREILHYRLKMLPPLTRHDIVQALRSSSMQEKALASKIELQWDLTRTVDDDDRLTTAQQSTNNPLIELGDEDVMDEEKQRQLLDEALEEGYITTNLDVLLFIGAGGSGKTCYKHLCLGLPPPEVRDSTGLSEHPVRTMSLVRTAVEQTPQNMETTDCNCQWTGVTEEQFQKLIMETVGEGEYKKLPDSAVMTESENKAAEGSIPDMVHDEDNTEGERPASSRHILIHYQSNYYQQLRDELRKRKFSAPSLTKRVKLLDVDWIYVVDSGGQPQFREMLPLLVQMATACVLTVKLNVPLGILNEVECVEKGKELCKPYSSVLTNEQIVKHCSQIVDSQTKDCKLFVVGTHRDLEDECKTESRADKNGKLYKLLKPQLRDNLAEYKPGRNVELIYPVNSQKPGKRDCEVVQQFRNAVHDISSLKKKVDVPLCWFLLELLLQHLAAKGDIKSDSESAANGDAKSGILSFEGSKQAAINQLKMSDEPFSTAVKFLAKNLGTILYFKDQLPNVIFTPQALMSILSKIVKICHLLNGDQPLPSHQRHKEKWSEFQRFGLMDKTLLQTESFKGFFSNIFGPDDFLKLMKKLLIVAETYDKKFFFPSVLEELTSEEVQKHIESCECLAPLVLHCPDTTVDCRSKENWLPVGSFTSLVAQLLNVHKWSLCTDDIDNPLCLHRNCIQFTLPDNLPGIVTLVDKFRHMEVYLQVDPETIRTSSKTVGSTIHNELQAVFKHLNYSGNDVKKAFLCPKHNNSHIATLARSDRGQWRWTCKKYRYESGALTEKQLPWLQDTLGVLAPDDLAELESALHKVAHKCIAFGLQLGVKDHKIQAIKKDNPNQCSDQLRAILSYRLKQLPLLTWQDVIRALKSKPVDENDLASEIESKYTN